MGAERWAAQSTSVIPTSDSGLQVPSRGHAWTDAGPGTGLWRKMLKSDTATVFLESSLPCSVLWTRLCAAFQLYKELAEGGREE